MLRKHQRCVLELLHAFLLHKCFISPLQQLTVVVKFGYPNAPSKWVHKQRHELTMLVRQKSKNIKQKIKNKIIEQTINSHTNNEKVKWIKYAYPWLYIEVFLYFPFYFLPPAARSCRPRISLAKRALTRTKKNKKKNNRRDEAATQQADCRAFCRRALSIFHRLFRPPASLVLCASSASNPNSLCWNLLDNAATRILCQYFARTIVCTYFWE